MIVQVVDGNAELVAWLCFGLGAGVLLAGVGLGIVVSLRRTVAAAAQVETAKQELSNTANRVEDAKSEIESIKASKALEGGGPPDTSAAETAAAGAATSAQAAKSAVEQIQGALASLPENLRFAGLLILVGAALMSVATVQFGETSLF